jgi:protein phosphatase
MGRERTNNEDATLNLDMLLTSELRLEPVGLYAVADGMGGHEKGEVASSMTLSLLYTSLAPMLLNPNSAASNNEVGLPDIYAQQIAQTISKAIEEINQQIYQKGNGNMGTTLTMCFVQNNKAYIANIGDSRTYLWRQGQLTPLTEDDSLVYSFIKSGQLSREDIYTHPDRNKLLQSLGSAALSNIEVIVQPLRAGDLLLLCSDGLWEMVHDTQLAQILTANSTPVRIVEELIEAANTNGGEDNIGLVLVEIF